MRFKIFMIAISLMSFKSIQAGVTGFTDFNFYYDTRSFAVFTPNTLLNLSDRVQYFQFINFENQNDNQDLETFYSEQNLRFNLTKFLPFRYTFQTVLRQGGSNDFYRLGVLWDVHRTFLIRHLFSALGMKFMLNLHVFQLYTNHNSSSFSQLEWVYRISPKFLKGRAYIGGFADQTFNDDGSTSWVTEHQLGIKLYKGFHAVAEFRYNDYMTEKVGLGYGLQYIVNFQ